MTTAVGVFAKTLNIKGMHIDRVDFKEEQKSRDGESYTQANFYVHARPFRKLQCECPICRRACTRHDTQRKGVESKWRAPNMNGAHVYICYTPSRVECPEHGVHTEYLPWADGNSRFTASFNNEVAFLALSVPKTIVSEFLDIDWQTVGHCIKAAHDRLEPDTGLRLRNLRRICIDETSYKKGHKYITVVVDMDTNQVVWIHTGHDNETISEFCELLTPEEQKRIEIVAGDGAAWIDYACKTYLTNAERCLDPFHVVGWINKALDDIRSVVSGMAKRQLNQEKAKMEEEAERLHKEWLEEYARYIAAKEELNQMTRRRGRRSKRTQELLSLVQEFESLYGETMDLLSKSEKGELTEEQKKRLEELREKADAVKGSKYALEMNPENLADYNADRLKLIEVTCPELYEAYQLKETLRVIVHMTSVELAKQAIKDWVDKASQSKFTAMRSLAEKIDRRTEGILNSIRYSANSAKSEQTNSLIKGLIHSARGFRNMDNMFAMIYLRCSEIVIPLANRYRPSPEMVRAKREYAAAQRHMREEAKHAKIA